VGNQSSREARNGSLASPLRPISLLMHRSSSVLNAGKAAGRIRGARLLIRSSLFFQVRGGLGSAMALVSSD